MILPPRDPKLVKSSPGRGSWPGPTITSSSSSTNLTTELSKSEQQLPSSQYQRKVNYISKYSIPTEPREAALNKSSNESASHQPGRLPPSKSEDTLYQSKYSKMNKQSPMHHRSGTITSLSASTSPLLNTRSSANSNLTHYVRHRTVSDSAHLLGPDENSTPNLALPSKIRSNGSGGKHKLSKSTASVAAMATSLSDNYTIGDNKDDSVLMPAPLPGILQVFFFFIFEMY